MASKINHAGFMPGTIRVKHITHRRKWWKFWKQEYVVNYYFESETPSCD